MFDSVLLCSDLSAVSEQLLACISELKSIGTRKVVLLHVIYVANTPGLDDRLRVEAKPELARQKKFLEDQGFEVIVETLLGLPRQVIADTADKYHASFVLLGTHGKGGE